MKTYTDDDVRRAIAGLVAQSTWRKAATHLGLDVGYLYRMVNGERPVSLELAAAVGFTPVDRRWQRAARSGKETR